MQSETKAHVDQITSPGGQPVTVLRFEGDISSTSKEAVLGTYQGLPKGDVKLILLDFTKVDYINSSGIAVCIQLLIEAANSGQKVSALGYRRTSSKCSPWLVSPSMQALTDTGRGACRPLAWNVGINAARKRPNVRLKGSVYPPNVG